MNKVILEANKEEWRYLREKMIQNYNHGLKYLTIGWLLRVLLAVFILFGAAFMMAGVVTT